LGWGSTRNKEFFTLLQLSKEFSLKRVGKASAIFDMQKLNHINGLHIKNTPEKEFSINGLHYIRSFHNTMDAISDDMIRALLLLYKDRIKCFDDFVHYTDYLYLNEITLETAGIAAHLSTPDSKRYLELLHDTLASLDTNVGDTGLEHAVRARADEQGLKAAQLIHPLRLVVTGRGVSPNIFSIMAIMGKEKVLEHIRFVIDNWETIVGKR